MSDPRPPRRRLPVRPSLEHLKKQAKRLARAHPGMALSDAQHRLAGAYGCRSWTELSAMVAAMNRAADILVDVPPTRRPLPVAVRAQDVPEVERVLAEGAFTPLDLDMGLAHACWYDGDNPATRATRRRLFELLLAAGADPDGQYGSGYGPIVLGTGECLSFEGLQWLLEAGCDVTFAPVDTKYGPASPMISVLSSDARGRNDRKHAMIDLLLARGALLPPEVTPPLLAVHRGDAAALERLLDSDSGLLARPFDPMPFVDCRGGTLLHCASALGERECVRLLLERGADVNAGSRADDLTPLHLAARRGDAETAEVLLSHGADPGRRAAPSGESPSDWARRAGCEALAVRLESPPP